MASDKCNDLYMAAGRLGHVRTGRLYEKGVNVVSCL